MYCTAYRPYYGGSLPGTRVPGRARHFPELVDPVQTPIRPRLVLYRKLDICQFGYALSANVKHCRVWTLAWSYRGLNSLDRVNTPKGVMIHIETSDYGLQVSATATLQLQLQPPTAWMDMHSVVTCGTVTSIIDRPQLEQRPHPFAASEPFSSPEPAQPRAFDSARRVSGRRHWRRRWLCDKRRSLRHCCSSSSSNLASASPSLAQPLPPSLVPTTFCDPFPS